MKKNRFNYKLVSETVPAVLSIHPQGHTSLKLDDGLFTPVCIIPAPLGGERTQEGKSVYAEAVKDELMKRWNSRPRITQSDIERAKYTAVNDFKMSLRVKYAKGLEVLRDRIQNGIFTKENDGDLVGINVMMNKILCEILEYYQLPSEALEQDKSISFQK